jgi:hypothetical protein
MKHRDIKDKDLRAILANELQIIRKLYRQGVYDEDAKMWLRCGLYTALRRVQFARDKAGQI